MNLTGDDTVWVGFFTLPPARCTAETHRIIQSQVSEHNHEWPPSAIDDRSLIKF